MILLLKVTEGRNLSGLLDKTRWVIVCAASFLGSISAVFAEANAVDSQAPVDPGLRPSIETHAPIPLPAGLAPISKDPFQAAVPLAPLANVLDKIELSALSAPAPVKGMLAVKVVVRNNTDRPLNFEGDLATLSIGASNLSSAPMLEVEKRIKQPDNPHGYFLRSMENTVTAATTVGAVQTVDGQVRLTGPIQQRYGWDNIRRIDRQSMFAKRVLWPGDSTEGNLFFLGTASASGAALKIPVCAFYDRADKQLITVTVK